MHGFLTLFKMVTIFILDTKNTTRGKIVVFLYVCRRHWEIEGKNRNFRCILIRKMFGRGLPAISSARDFEVLDEE